jgi:hypothetical protein
VLLIRVTRSTARPSVAYPLLLSLLRIISFELLLSHRLLTPSILILQQFQVQQIKDKNGYDGVALKVTTGPTLPGASVGESEAGTYFRMPPDDDIGGTFSSPQSPRYRAILAILMIFISWNR